MEKILPNLPKIPIQKRVWVSLPQSTGIYVFFDKETPIYIGKAINLKARVKSYFNLNLSTKTTQMVNSASSISFIKVESEFEALLLEARLIRNIQPHYNIISKDDKHPLYIAITKEAFPRVITVRKTDLEGSILARYGPFPSSGNVKSVLKMIRRIFPYSDHKIGKRACLYSHIGLCNPCPNEIVLSTEYLVLRKKTQEYKKNIKKIKQILDGKIDSVKKEMQKEMEIFSKDQQYEEALIIRNRIEKLEYITRPQMPTDYYLENPNLYEDIRRKELNELSEILSKYLISNLSSLKSVSRIECYDIAHLAGTNTTASMVTFIDGEPEKKLYRHFRIKQNKTKSDVDSLSEVIKRRKKHFESWGKPDLIIVDGGKAQLAVFLKELEGTGISVIGLAKRYETIVFPNGEYRLEPGPAKNLVTRIRDEAHRFARVYHHKLITKNLLY